MQFIDLHRQYEQIEDKVKDGLFNVLEHKKFIMGSEVSALEERLANYVGVKNVICCASGTDALTIPLRAYDVTENDAIFVPSFTFFASAESISLAGANPVFVDCEEDTFNMSASSLKEAIAYIKKEGRLNPKGIIAVDLFGLPANFQEIQNIADENDMFLLEDAAQGFGGRIGAKKACSFGNISATSFFPAKPLGCYGDGGAIFTDDDELADRIRSIHIHGQGSDKYDNIRLGLNSRLDTMQAVILDAKLDIFDDELDKRNRIANKYKELLDGIICTPDIPDGFYSSWAQFTLRIKEGQSREEIIKHMKELGVPTAVYYPIPVHLSSAYLGIRDNQIRLPNTEKLSKQVFSIPMHPYLKDEEVIKICDAVRKSIFKEA
ncbi:MAG: DegT/DnrJ/EryC1/StrS family aminotransferase [Anaerovoracaceae bacterium]